MTQSGKLAHWSLKLSQEVSLTLCELCEICAFMGVCMLIWVSFILCLYSFPQQKGQSYRFGVLVPFGGHPRWTRSQGLTSQASGLGTPMDPILPVWKTKPHRYIEKKDTVLVGPYWKGLYRYCAIVVCRLLKLSLIFVKVFKVVCKNSKWYLQHYYSLKRKTHSN